MNSSTSVSLGPPLLLVGPGSHLSSYDIFCDCTRFGLSILAEGQEDISNLFASGTGDRYAVSNWSTPHGGISLINGRAAGLTCDLEQKGEAGDHVIRIGCVTHFDNGALSGLGYGPDGYFSRSRERTAETPQAVTTRASALLEDEGRILLTDTLHLPTADVPPAPAPRLMA